MQNVQTQLEVIHAHASLAISCGMLIKDALTIMNVATVSIFSIRWIRTGANRY